MSQKPTPKISTMKDLLNVLKTICLIVIASTLVLDRMEKKTDDTRREEVVEVVGRYNQSFDGFSGSPGFLVKSQNGLKIIPYDSGSMADNEEFTPKYLSVAWFPNQSQPMILPGNTY